MSAKNLSTKLADEAGPIQRGEPKASPASAAPVPPAAPNSAHCRGWGCKGPLFLRQVLSCVVANKAQAVPPVLLFHVTLFKNVRTPSRPFPRTKRYSSSQKKNTSFCPSIRYLECLFTKLGSHFGELKGTEVLILTAHTCAFVVWGPHLAGEASVLPGQAEQSLRPG